MLFRSLHGSAPLMDDDVLEDIIKYASRRKLLTAESLRVNACWRRAQVFGEQVLQVVNSFIPQARGDVGGDNARPLRNNTGQFINLGVESVSFFFCKADCMISWLPTSSSKVPLLYFVPSVYELDRGDHAINFAISQYFVY